MITAAFDAGRPAAFPKPGSVIRREYKGKVIVVRVLPRGFEYEGEVYWSLTAIVQKLTGGALEWGELLRAALRTRQEGIGGRTNE